jgi:hypothetical protein
MTFQSENSGGVSRGTRTYQQTLDPASVFSVFSQTCLLVQLPSPTATYAFQAHITADPIQYFHEGSLYNM